MTAPFRHLLVLDASLADDPYLCWLYAAQFAATADAEPGSIAFLPLFEYRGPRPERLSIPQLSWDDSGKAGEKRSRRKSKSIWRKLRLTEDPAVIVSSLSPQQRGFLRVIRELHAGLASIVLFGRNPVDVVELAKLVHVGSDNAVPPMVGVIQRWQPSRIITAGLRGLAIPLYVDVGFNGWRGPATEPDGTIQEALSFWKEEEYPFPPHRGPEAQWASILGPLSARARAPVVLFLRPDWPRCGSFTTFTNIALRYAERGTVILDVAINENKRKYSASEAIARISDSRDNLSPAFAFASARSLTLQSKWQIRAHRPHGLVAEHVERYTQAAAPAWLQELLRASRPDYAYVNHYFTLDYLRRLRLDIPIILDVHDIQAVNYVHHKYSSGRKGRSETFSDLLEQEVQFLRRAASVAFVSADEMELVAPKLPETDKFHFIAVPRVMPVPRDHSGDKPSRPPRVLIVASRNRGNEENLDWFLGSVWPLLEGSGALLDVVGGIKSYFDGKPKPEGCTLHGGVAELAPYYADADVVALPIVTGGGVAIKTVEALLYGRPICATPHAFRGLGEALRSRFPRLDDAATFAEDLKALIASPGAAQQRLELCRQAARDLTPERFDAAFDARHQAMLAGRNRAESAKPTARAALGSPAIGVSRQSD
jgi:glycosyltransferase involved in cell wall biosynthesis